MSNEASPGGYVVVLFGDKADGWCTLSRCPLGIARWFPTPDSAERYVESVPESFEPHILLVDRR